MPKRLQKCSIVVLNPLGQQNTSTMNPTEMVSKLWAIMWFSIVIKVFALNKELVYPSKQRKRVSLPCHGLPEKTQVSVYLT